MNVQFYKGISDANAATGRNASGSGYIPNGSITFTNERHIWVKEADNKAYQYGGTEKMGTGSSSVAVGGIDKNYNYSNKSVADVVKDLLSAATYAPKFTDATGGKILLTGNDNSTITYILANNTKLPNADNIVLSSANSASAGFTNSLVYGGSASLTKSLSSGNWGADVTSRGSYTISGTTTFAAGADTVKDSAGNKTNFTSNNETTRLSDAKINTNIDANTYVIKSITKTPESLTLQYALPIYCFQGLNADNTRKSISPNESISYTGNRYSFNVGDVIADKNSVTRETKLTFVVPSSYTSVKIQTKDPTKDGTVSNDDHWFDQPYLSTTSTIKIGNVTYTEYTYNIPLDYKQGATKWRLAFTIQ